MVILHPMSKQTGIIIGVVAVLAILGVIAFTQLNKPQAPTSQIASSEKQTEPTPSVTKGTIQSLISAGKNVTCNLTYPDGNGEGMVYVSGSKVRGDFTVKVNESSMLTHMIQDGSGYFYMWSDTDKTGTKFKFDPNAPKPSIKPSNQPEAVDLEKEVDLKCDPWTVDNAKFEVPADVKFTDMSQIMNNATKNMGSSVPKVDKSICDNIQDPESKAACLKALGN